MHSLTHHPTYRAECLSKRRPSWGYIQQMYRPLQGTYRS
nr:MAG TPA: hypothetical protein [Caudoviricetes sp.]